MGLGGDRITSILSLLYFYSSYVYNESVTSIKEILNNNFMVKLTLFQNKQRELNGIYNKNKYFLPVISMIILRKKYTGYNI